MKELVEKISSYNLFNNLFPGILFVVLITKVTNYNLIQEDIIIGVFLYYFIGMVISRLGSLILEPFLKKIGFVKFANYPDFIVASEKDTKIIEFSEINNTYRTVAMALISVATLKLYEHCVDKFAYHTDTDLLALVVLLICLFIFSYKKQTAYITKRINKIVNQ